MRADREPHLLDEQRVQRAGPVEAVGDGLREVAQHRVLHVGRATQAADFQTVVLAAEVAQIAMRQLDEDEIKLAVEVGAEISRKVANVDGVVLKPPLGFAGPAVDRPPVAGVQRYADQEAAIAGRHLDALELFVAHAFAVERQAARGPFNILG